MREDAESFFGRAVTAMGEAVITSDLRGRVTSWNPAAERLYGYRAPDALGREVTALLLPADATSDSARGHLHSGEHTVRDVHGRTFTVVVTATPLTENGKVLGTVMISYEPGAHDGRRTRAALAAERQYRARFDRASLPQAVMDLAGRVVSANDAFCELLGRPRRDVEGTHAAEFRHPADRGDEGRLRVALSGRATAPWERVLQRPDGTPVRVLVHAAPLPDDDGSAVAVAVFLQDLSLLREAERALLRREALFEAFSRQVGDWLMFVGVDGRIGYASGDTASIFGRRPSDLSGRDLWGLVHPADVGHAREAFDAVASTDGAATATVFRVGIAAPRLVEHAFANYLDVPGIGAVVCKGREVAGEPRR